MGRGGSRERSGRPKNSGVYGEASDAIRVPMCVINGLDPYLQKYKGLIREIREAKNLNQKEKDSLYDNLGNCWDWLLEKIGSNVELLEIESPSNLLDLSEYRERRLYSSAVAATPEIVNEGDDNTYEKKTLDEILLRKTDESFFLRVSGNSMIDAGIEDGSILIVEPHDVWKNGEPKEGQIVIAVVGQSTQVVKIFYRESKHKILLLSANEQYPPIVITEENQEQLLIQGIVYRHMPPPLQKMDLSKYLAPVEN
ncbi:MAG: hypothetical protein F6K11_09415 [Leptolyngbya sp. SIO3F4]|nr:hypothetical protein [Leptolyngbya sp. SIO3F4]